MNSFDPLIIMFHISVYFCILGVSFETGNGHFFFSITTYSYSEAQYECLQRNGRLFEPKSLNDLETALYLVGRLFGSTYKCKLPLIFHYFMQSL